MVEVSSSLPLAWLLTFLFHSTLLLSIAWLATRALKQAPRLCECLWKTALLGGLLTSTAQVALDLDPWLGRIRLGTGVSGEQAGMLAARAPSDVAQAGTAPMALVQQGTELSPERSPQRFARISEPRSEVPPAKGERSELGARALPVPLAQLAQLALESGWASARSLLDAPRPASGQPPRGLLAGPGPRASGEDAARLPGLLASSLSSSPSLLNPQGPPSVDWRTSALALWIGGALLALAVLWLAWRRLERRLGLRCQVKEGPLVEMLEQLRLRAGFERPVRLSFSARLSAPVAMGLWRPEICLPLRAASHLSRSQQRCMLAHELAHLRRGDPTWLLLARALECVFFFQPLHRVARAQLQDAAEFLCDDQAARWTGGGLELASCLTEVASWVLGPQGQGAPRLLPGMAAQGSRLGARVRRLLDAQATLHREERPWWLAAPLGLALAVPFAAPGASAAAPTVPSERAQQSSVDTGLSTAAADLEQEVRLDLAALLETSLVSDAAPLEASLPQPAPVPAPVAAPTPLEQIAQAFGELDSEIETLSQELQALEHVLASNSIDELQLRQLRAIEVRAAQLLARRKLFASMQARLQEQLRARTNASAQSNPTTR